MARKRKTAAEVREARALVDIRAREAFMLELKGIVSYVDALERVHRSSDRSPARKYYANLGFFLQTYAAPDGASSEELAEYIRLIGSFDAEGAVKPGLRAGLEDALREARARRV